MTNDMLLKKLERPGKKVRAVLDTDAYNEIDDQFAVAYMLKKPEFFDVLALTAAPFSNSRSDGPENGMELSYDELLKLLDLMDREDMKNRVFKGSRTYLPDEKTPVESPAARKLVELSNNSTPEDPLYIIAIGAITNVASAILIDPAIVDKCVVVWLGGNAHHWQNTDEFNMQQDIAAARVVFDSGVPVVQLPCAGVVSELKTTAPELEFWLKGKNKISDYLAENTILEAESYAKGTAWSRVIWDVSAIAWFINGSFMSECVVPIPICEYNHQYTFESGRHPYKYIYNIDRDAIFTDLFRTLIS